MTTPASTPTATLASRPFIGFGQFHRHGNFAAAAFVIFHRRDLARARKALLKSRLESGIPATVRFDGTAVFDSAERSRRGLGDMNDSATHDALARLVKTASGVPGMLRYTYLDTEAYPAPLDESESGQTEQAILRQVLLGRCFAVPAGGTHGPQAHECEPIVADTADRTAHAHAVLLDLADAMARCCARAVAGGEADRWVQGAIIEGFQYWSNTEVVARAPEAAA